MNDGFAQVFRICGWNWRMHFLVSGKDGVACGRRGRLGVFDWVGLGMRWKVCWDRSSCSSDPRGRCVVIPCMLTASFQWMRSMAQPGVAAAGLIRDWHVGHQGA
jgi:hypothetical protein